MTKITIEYCNSRGYKSYDGTELKDGQVLAPILFSDEMIANDNTVIRENLRTWTHYGAKFKVGFMPVDRQEFDSMVKIFNFQVNGYMDDHPEFRPGRCLLGFDSKGFPVLCNKENRCKGCPHRYEDLPRYRNLEDYIQFLSLDSGSLDDDGNEIPMEIADTSHMPVDEEAMLGMLFEELVEDLEQKDKRHAKIAMLGAEGKSKEEIFNAINLRTSSGYTAFTAAKQATKNFLND